MCRSVRLNANQAWRQLRKERQHLLAVQLLHQHRGAVLIDAVRLENALRQIQSYRRNPHRERSSFCSGDRLARSEEHTSELQSLMRISYAVFCLKKKNKSQKITITKSTVDNSPTTNKRK